jgi:hypothetical protein
MFKKEMKFTNGTLYMEDKSFEVSDMTIKTLDIRKRPPHNKLEKLFGLEVARAILRYEGTLKQLGSNYEWKSRYPRDPPLP